MKVILQEMIYENYVLNINMDTLYLELLEETLQTRGKNLYKKAKEEIYFEDYE